MATRRAQDGVPDPACSGFNTARGGFDFRATRRRPSANHATAGRTGTASPNAAFFAKARAGNAEGRRARGCIPGSVLWRATHASIEKRDSSATVAAAVGVVRLGNVLGERQRVRGILDAIDARAATRNCPAQADQPVPGQ